MSQLNPSRYKRLTKSMDYGVSDGLYWDSTNGELVMVIDDTVKAKFPATQTAADMLISDGTKFQPLPVDGSAAIDQDGLLLIQNGAVDPEMLAKPCLRVASEQLTAASLTDGGAAVGTKTLGITIPAGARFIASTVDMLFGFAGNVSATLTLGDGSDVDRYNTGTPSIFTTSAAGVDMGVPSGTAFHSADKAVVATVTSATDITLVLAGGGSCYVRLWFLEPV